MKMAGLPCVQIAKARHNYEKMDECFGEVKMLESTIVLLTCCDE